MEGLINIGSVKNMVTIDTIVGVNVVVRPNMHISRMYVVHTLRLG